MEGLIIGAVVLLLLIILIIRTYNQLVPIRNNVKNAFAQIETQLQRRFDLIPNLVEIVKGYSVHEKDVMQSIAESRNKFMRCTSNAEKMAANNQLNTSLRSLYSYVENYPDLKANMNFIRLQEELSVTEQKIAYARQFYNDAVTIYNNKRQTFPNVIVAKICGFKQGELFSSGEGADKAPYIQF
jgi:LemA protein